MSKSIGAYTVIQALVQPGEAYLAKSADGRSCTIRLVDLPGDDERVERARTETLACAAIHHASVALVTDLFEHEGKTAVIGPAPVDGVSLATLIARVGARKLSPEAVWYVGLQIASAVSLAHATEVDGDFIPVCHGHLSPMHVWVGFDGTVRVDGFGLAPFVGQSGFEAEEGFTAPEQQRGGRISPRGDVYSVAAILWELLSGNEPHAAMSVSDVAGDVPESFIDAFGRALEPKVGNRRITSMEMEQFLSELVDESATGHGKKALATTMAAFKKGATLLGHTKKERDSKKQPPQIIAEGPSTKRGGGGKLGGALGGGTRGPQQKSPPMRSKQNTLLGAIPARGRMDSVPIDWDAASKAASDTVSPPALDALDELTWGDGDEELAPTPSPSDFAIEDEDSDQEEMTMMNEAGAELRAAMDKAKAARDSNKGEQRTTLRPKTPKAPKVASAPPQEETTLIRSRKKLERGDQKLAALAVDDGEVAVESEDLTVMRDRLDPADDAKTRKTLAGSPPVKSGPGRPPPAKPSRPGTSGPPRPKPSGRALPRPSEPEPETLRSSEPPDSEKKAGKKSQPELMRTLASAGVDESDAPPPPRDTGPDSKPIKNLVIDIGDTSTPGLDPELDSAVIPLAAPSSEDSAPEESDPGPIEVPRKPSTPPVEVEMPVAEPASVSAQPPGSVTPSGRPSPWSKDDAPAAEAPREERPIPKLLAALIITVTAVAVMGVGVLILRQNSTVGPAPSLPSAAPTPTPAAKPKVSATAKPSASAAPSAAPSTEPSGALAPPEVDASTLPATMGYLTVVFTGDDKEAIVSSLGKDIGKVGEPNQVVCARPAFIRVKSARGIWLSDGKTVNVKCQAVTTIEVKAK